MSILRKLKSLLGVDDDGDDAERDVTVTVEHDPENEAAVKGADVEESGPGSDGNGTIAESASDSTTATEGAVSEPEPEDSETAADTADEESGDADDETPDEVEIPDAEEPVDDTAGESEAEDDGEPESENVEEPENAEEDYEVDAETGDDSAAGEPVDVLTGIGSAYAERLDDAGVTTVAELADADAEELSEATDIAPGRIQNWIDQAAEY